MNLQNKIPPIIDEWKDLLQEELKKPYIYNIIDFIDNELIAGKNIYPPKKQIFNAFNQTPPSTLKVVIIGQDPYHGPNQAHGLCFSVQKGIKPPPSLINIFKEIRTDLKLSVPNHGDLTAWARQGVLLLNAMLTVEANKAGSHSKIGWAQFTDAVIKTISETQVGIVFILWGRFAQSKKELININKHFILESAHPSPFSATNFFGCRHFSKTNEILKSIGKSSINWQID